jgi:hypothetical protein
MQQILKRLSSLAQLAQPLALVSLGIVLFSLGVAYFIIAVYREVGLPDIFYYLTLQFLPRYARGALLTVVGLLVLVAGLWRLAGVAVIRLENATTTKEGNLLLGYQRVAAKPRMVVMAGGPGAMVLSNIGPQTRQLTCITPVQDPVEYYYRAASLFDLENVVFVPPAPAGPRLFVTLENGMRLNIKDERLRSQELAHHHAVDLALAGLNDEKQPTIAIFREAREALLQADVIVFGPGSLFESVLPNLLIPEIRDTIRQSKARKIFICNLMTEPGLTTGFGVAEHVHELVRFGGFTPDYVLVNAQRIEPEVRRIYEAAYQRPVYLNPDEYEETIVSQGGRTSSRDLLVEGAVVIEADLASSVVQLTASLDNPSDRLAVRVLRHDSEKLLAAIKGLITRNG